MGRRFTNTPPPRPSSSRSSSGGYSDQGLPTNNPITFSSNRTKPTQAARQARMVGDLASSRHADAQENQQQMEGTEGENASSQPSVLDAANMNPLPSGSMYDDEPSSTDDSPADAYNKKNENFRRDQALATQRQQQFNAPPPGEDGQPFGDQSPANGPLPQNAARRSVNPAEESRRKIELLKQQQGASNSLMDQKNPRSGATTGHPQDKPLPVTGVSPNQLKEMTVNISDLLSAGSGVGLLWSVPKVNLAAMNTYFNSRLLPGYRSPKERANPGTKNLDRIIIVEAMIVNLIATIYLLPIIGMIAAIVAVAAVFVYGAAYLTPFIGDLATQLMN